MLIEIFKVILIFTIPIMYYFLGRAKGEEVGRQEIVDEVLELIREKVKDNTDCSELFKIIKR